MPLTGAIITLIGMVFAHLGVRIPCCSRQGADHHAGQARSLTLPTDEQSQRQIVAHESTSMTHSHEPPVERSAAELTGVVDRNIRALLERRRTDDRQRDWQDRPADGITRFTGSMRFVYLHVLVFGLWIVVNLPWLALPRFDPSYVVLAMVVSVEAIFLLTFVSITQNRITAEADKRADLDLHISLLAEHEISRLIRLVTEITRQMGIHTAEDPELAELAQDVAPEKILNTMEAYRQQVKGEEPQPRKP
jgi:uncharacterized membrane protein